MPNNPTKSDQKRPEDPKRRNAQDQAEGSAHSPEEFDVMNPARTGGKSKSDVQEQN